MKEPPIHPDTGEPITAEQLVTESDALDDALRSGAFAGLVTRVAGLRKVNERLTVLVKILGVVAVIAVATAAFSLYWALRVDHNAREINQTQKALQAYCEQTNVNNAEAQTKFVAKFGPTTPPDQQQQLADFVEVLFPQRDCTNVVESTEPVTVP